MSGSGMIGVDVGGTFTDCVFVEDGQIRTTKVLVDAAARERPVIEGAATFGVERAGIFNHATTVGLNAILTRELPKVGFITTAGHRDILDMGRAWRPLSSLTDPHWRRSFGDAARPLVPRYLRRGIRERMRADGTVFLGLDEVHAREELRTLACCKVEGIAVCLLNSYVNPVHETRLRELILDELGEIPCSLSIEVSPLAKEFPRASSTVLDVLMKLIYTGYTHSLIRGLREHGFDGQLNFADCAASLVTVDHAMERPLRVISSGPAAGTVSCAHFGRLIGQEQLICCDVGGTSSDISLVSVGRPVVNTAFEIEHDLLANTAATDIATIGAGGGSLVSVTPTGELAVGPESAGGDPGPACYGRGGTVPTTTDTCLLIGILSAEEPLGGRLALDPERSRAAFEALDSPLGLQERVRHAYELALNNISEGIIDIAVRRGVDPRDYTLLAYGSAGPMLLPPLLEQVGVKAVVVPPHPGLFSALGLLSTDLVYGDQRSVYVRLGDDGAGDTVAKIYAELEERIEASIGRRHEGYRISRTFDARLVGQTWETPFVTAPAGAITDVTIEEMIGGFHDAYHARWGNRFPEIEVEAVTFRVEMVVDSRKVSYPEVACGSGTPSPRRAVELRYLRPEPFLASEYRRDELRFGDTVHGPAIVREPMATTQVAEGQIATVGRLGELVISAVEGDRPWEGSTR